tara:strand:- start:1043 stop:1240 length:198 start_codon:yes stop_codon:yes gene_type:complete
MPIFDRHLARGFGDSKTDSGAVIGLVSVRYIQNKKNITLLIPPLFYVFLFPSQQLPFQPVSSHFS